MLYNNVSYFIQTVINYNKTIYIFQSYHFDSTLGKNIIFLSGHNQERYNDAFANAMPWFHFGRKNVGYLFAIANAAKAIWDFDDDNILKFWIKGASPDDSLELDHYIENIKSMYCPASNYNDYCIIIHACTVYDQKRVRVIGISVQKNSFSK